MSVLAPYLVTLVVSLIAAFIILPFLIRKLPLAGIVGVDLNKVARKLAPSELYKLKTTGLKGFPVVPRSGGIAMVFGYCAGILLSLWLVQSQTVPLMLAGLLVVCLISMIGIIEDFLPISQFWRMLLPAFAALPLIFIGAGNPVMALPLVGDVNFGLLYFIALVPAGVIAASNLFNLLAGFNGIEAGSGAVVSAALFVIAFSRGEQEAAFLAAALFGVCIAFLFFNWFPARIFPGNSGTYLIGGAVAAIVIIGNMEKAGVIALIPQIAEFFLKATSRFKAENFGLLQKDGKLKYDGPIHSLTHAAMRFGLTEQQVVLVLLAVQAVFGVIAVYS